MRIKNSTLTSHTSLLLSGLITLQMVKVAHTSLQYVSHHCKA
ncbi:hypothetical protein [Psychrobacter celer]